MITSGRRPWSRIVSKICKALCGNVPFSHALVKALYVIALGRRPWCRIIWVSYKALCGCAPFSKALIKAS